MSNKKLPKGIRVKGGTYHVTASLTRGGKMSRKYGSADDLDTAIALKAQLQLELLAESSPGIDSSEDTATDTQANVVQMKWTIQQACTLAEERQWSQSKSNYPKNMGNPNLVVKYFGKDTPLAAIDAEWIAEFVDECISEKNTGSTINRKLSALSVMFDQSMEFPKRTGIRFKPFYKRKSEGEPRTRYLSDDEESQIEYYLIKWGKFDHLDGFRVLLDTGLRSSELWLVPGKDVNLDDEVPFIKVTMERSKTKSTRSVPLSARAIEILKRRKELYGDGLLFPGMSVHIFRNQWRKIRSKMGLDDDPGFVPYTTRHTCASRMLNEGIKIDVISDWLGHTDIKMTRKYAVTDQKRLKGGLDALEERRAKLEKKPALAIVK